MTDISFLEKVDVFKGLSDAQLTAISEKCETLSLSRKDQLFAQGEPSTHLWLVLEGEIDLRQEKDKDDDTSISFVSRSDTFGWTCFVPPYQYRLTAVCASHTCRVIRITKKDLESLFQADVSIGYRVMKYLIQAVGRHFQEFQDELAKVRGHDIMHQW
ncbi:cyclic nucleotide-binding domain-containing protein [Desulfobacterales bacterium HSG17]|nr:cyclic nucleotide-binding domain-containing protein [Desulfobacterales bacterium HSG17]